MRLDRDVLHRCRETYVDGMGIMYPAEKENRVITFRTMNDFDQIWNRYTTARDKNLPVAVHFRRTTAGSNTVENCHPMRIGEREIAFMHNGTLSNYTDLIGEDDDISDTRLFKDQVLEHMPTGFLGIDGLWTTISESIGRNRLLFMDGNGRWSVFNSSVGFWWKGVWFSHKRDRTFITRGPLSQRSTTTVGTHGRSGGSSVDRESRSFHCWICDSWGDHRPADCDRVEEKKGRATGSCQFCGFFHPNRVCPQTRNGEGNCILCGSFGGHVNMGLCPQLNIECPGCGEDIEDGLVEIMAGYAWHSWCAAEALHEDMGEDESEDEDSPTNPLNCAKCGEVVRIDEERIFRGDRVIHSSCIKAESADDEEESELPDQVPEEKLSGVWTVYKLDNGNSYKAQGYDDEDMETSNLGLFYNGSAMCFSCIDDLNYYEPEGAYKIPIPQSSNMVCNSCGIVIFNRIKWYQKRYHDKRDSSHE